MLPFCVGRHPHAEGHRDRFGRLQRMDRFRHVARSIARTRQSRWLRWPGAVVTIVLLFGGLVGLPSIPDELAKWGPIGQWLADRGRDVALALQPLGADLARWTLVVLGVLLLLYFYLPVGWRSGLRRQRDPGMEADSIEPTIGQAVARPKTAGEVAMELNGFRERAGQLRRDFATRSIPADKAAFDVLVTEVNAYLRENGLAKYLPKIEEALEIGFFPGSVYDHMHVGQGVDNIYEVDSPRGHEVRLGRLRDALAAVLDDLPHPEYPVSMADQAKRQSVVRSVRRGLRKRWEQADGPVPPPPQTVFPRVDTSPEPTQPSVTQPTPPSQSEPTSEDIEARAEFLMAQVQDVSMNIFGSRNIHFGVKPSSQRMRGFGRRAGGSSLHGPVIMRWLRFQVPPPADRVGQAWLHRSVALTQRTGARLAHAHRIARVRRDAEDDRHRDRHSQGDARRLRRRRARGRAR